MGFKEIELEDLSICKNCNGKGKFDARPEFFKLRFEDQSKFLESNKLHLRPETSVYIIYCSICQGTGKSGIKNLELL